MDVISLEHGERAAGAEDATEFAERVGEIGVALHAVGRQDPVDGGVVEGKPFDAPFDQPHAARVDERVEPLFRRGEERRRRVEPDGDALRQPFGQQAREKAVAAAGVDDLLVRLPGQAGDDAAEVVGEGLVEGVEALGVVGKRIVHGYPHWQLACHL